MLSDPGSIMHRLLAGRGKAWFAAPVALVAIAGLIIAFSSDDDEGSLTPASAVVTATGEDATATPSRAVAAATPQSQGSGGLLPASPSSAAPTATTAVQAPAQPPAKSAALLDMAPCDSQTYYEVQTLPGGAVALTYKDVPEGTPIVFPFEEGRLRQADAQDGGIVLMYEVEDVGVFSVQAAGSGTLDRLVTRPVAGTVIGHFAGVFGDNETYAFEGYQLFAVAATTELTIVNNQLVAGEPLGLQVQDCIVLP
jgi:hypothetical protein